MNTAIDESNAHLLNESELKEELLKLLNATPILIINELLKRGWEVTAHIHETYENGCPYKYQWAVRLKKEL